MTPVEFQFNYPDGEPIANTEFVIKLVKSGFVPEFAGIIMPADTVVTTDGQGAALVALAPSDSPYTIRMVNPVSPVSEDSCTKGISYRFYVPISDEVVRVQDLVLNPPPTNLPYDQAAIQAITEAKVATVASATVAKEQADIAKLSAEQVAILAEPVEGLAAQAESASISAQSAAERAEESANASSGAVSELATALENGELIPFSLDGSRPGVGFIETFITQMAYPDVPANLTEYQASGTTSSIPTLNWAGNVLSAPIGGHIVSCEKTPIVQGAGNKVWPCVLENSDGTFEVNLVSGDDGEGNFTLVNALKKVPLRLTSRWDAPLGQHMTVTGTKAYAEHVYAQLTNECTANKMIGPWVGAMQPPIHQSLWALNANSLAYGRIVISDVATELLPESFEQNSAYNGRMTRVSREPGQVTIGVHQAGQGGVASWTTAGQRGLIEVFACTRAGRVTLSERGKASFKFIGVLDGVEYVLKRFTLNDQMQRLTCPFSGFDTVMVRAESEANYPFFLVLAESICWITEAAASRLINKDVKTVVFGDSWFEYYKGEFGGHLQSLIKADGGKGSVVSRGKAGMTTRYALDWLDQHVLSEPGVQQCIFHFFTNDLNNLGSATYLDPQGVAKPLNVNSRFELVANLRLLASRCEEAGVQPLIIMPAGKASASGAVEQQRATTLLRRPIYTDKAPPIKASELVDSASHINNYGKTLGKAVVVGTDVMYAQGRNSAAPWKNTQNNRLSLLESISMPVAAYDKNKIVIGTDSDGNGISDGILLAQYGINTGTSAEFTIAGSNQIQTMTYTDPLALGNTRMEYPVACVAGHKYVFIVDLAGGMPNLPFDIVQRFSVGTVNPITELFDGITGAPLATVSRVLDGTGKKLVFFVLTATTTGNLGVLLAPLGLREPLPSVQRLGVHRINVVDATEFSVATGVDLGGYTDFDLAKLFNASITQVAPTFIYLTDSVTGKRVKVTVSSGVISVS